MNRRRNLMAAALGVLLLSALLVPVAHLLSADGEQPLDQKQEAIARALEMERERETRPKPSPVQAVADIEAIWAIEDARTEADGPLVSRMVCGGNELGFDAGSATFYCTLGMETGDDWPEIALSASGEAGVQAVWVDDYSYDWCADAIAEGYRYELLAYTEEEYAYIGVVFTGLPIVTLHTEDAIVMGDDVAGRMTVAAADYDAVDAAMVVHERGGGFRKAIDKVSYRVEFHALGDNGRDEKPDVSLLGMEADSDWLLLSNAQDETAVRNQIAWELWNAWHPDGNGFMLLDTKMVEVFVNDEYKGLYQLMQRVQEEEEIAKNGGDLSVDCAARVIARINPTEKPFIEFADEDLRCRFEYRFEPNGDDERLFALLDDYVTLSRRSSERKLSDEEFERLALERVDVEDMMSYILFYHACTLRDHISNNIHIFIMQDENGAFRYRHAPWDMDTAFWVKPESEPEGSKYWPELSVTIPARMLEMDVGGCREIIWTLWNEKRTSVLSRDAVYARFTDMEAMINASGAYLRESEKWYGEAKPLNLTEMEYYAQQCLDLLRMTLESEWPVEGMTLEP